MITRRAEARHRIQSNKREHEVLGRCGLAVSAENLGGHSCGETMRNIRYLLEKYAHECFEKPLDLSKKRGRPFKVDRQKVDSVWKMLSDGISVQDVAAKLGISHSSVYRIKNHRNNYKALA